jgi:uncharacterized protein YbjT (DUF2867 family)
MHAIVEGGDYPAREARAAEAFAAAADAADVRRLVYLGGVAPQGSGSRHLKSRLRTGEILRAGRVPAFELRAAMIVGHGSASWQIVRDLAVRLPAMILPRWLQNHSWPVDIADVVFALLRSLDLPEDSAGWYDVPGPERLSHRQMLERVASHLGNRPVMFGVPVLTPRLSSYWIAVVTRADLKMAQELVEGLRTDLDPTGTVLWDLFPEHERVTIDAAIAGALDDERLPHATIPTPRMRERLERMVTRTSNP